MSSAIGTHSQIIAAIRQSIGEPQFIYVANDNNTYYTTRNVELGWLLQRVNYSLAIHGYWQHMQNQAVEIADLAQAYLTDFPLLQLDHLVTAISHAGR